MTPYDWYSDDEDNKEIRRKAANSFLSDVLDHPTGIGAQVTGLQPGKRQNAWTEFDKVLRKIHVGAALPPNVEVICIEEDTRKRADLVVFVLKKKGAKIDKLKEESTTDDDLWDGRWVAAWAPY
jgi:hypothetical protein